MQQQMVLQQQVRRSMPARCAVGSDGARLCLLMGSWEPNHYARNDISASCDAALSAVL
jgi:hypothetical protein